jgi:hypothetical protein
MVLPAVTMCYFRVTYSPLTHCMTTSDADNKGTTRPDPSMSDVLLKHAVFRAFPKSAAQGHPAVQFPPLSARNQCRFNHPSAQRWVS